MTQTLTEKEIDDLLKTGKIHFKKDVKWSAEKGFSHYKFKLENKIEVGEQKHIVTLHGTKNRITSDYTYALLLNKKRIRCLCPRKRHRNPIDNKQINGIHKHKFSDAYGDNSAYKPVDITDVNNMEKTFFEFLKECGISYEGSYTNPPIVQFGFPW